MVSKGIQSQASLSIPTSLTAALLLLLIVIYFMCLKIGSNTAGFPQQYHALLECVMNAHSEQAWIFACAWSSHHTIHIHGRIGVVGKGGANTANLYAITCIGGVGAVTITPYGNGTSNFGLCLQSNCTSSFVYWKAIVNSMSV